eukprot:TRINITY_DN2963_c0_g1_i1.p1 TRINITY_DN2963_c0_g1~~TRINITY_DN2963_c0_g1_i1.p1  ORF type:complete len:325 (-),score=3.91 TRINITY_DN2963_c0_g1_i1:59-1009(-)
MNPSKRVLALAVIPIIVLFLILVKPYTIPSVSSSSEVIEEPALKSEESQLPPEQVVQQQSTLPNESKIDNAHIEIQQEKPPTLEELKATVEDRLERVRAIKNSGTVMETDPTALQETKQLQEATRPLLEALYGKTDSGTYTITLHLKFPEGMPDADSTPSRTSTIVVETAPIKLMPHAVFVFMELMSNWQAGGFHRPAGHVLQALVNGPNKRGLAFQEYSEHYPHVIGTLGFAGRPGGPGFYINTMDNTHNHGPGSQGSQTEADSCFAKVISGMDTVNRMQEQWGGKSNFPRDKMGFLSNSEHFVAITVVKIGGLQ